MDGRRLRRVAGWFVAGLLAAVPAPRAAAADQAAPVELRTALRELVETLPGQYDNAAQQFFATESRWPAGRVPPRVHRAFVALDAPTIGEHVILSTIRAGGSRAELDLEQVVVWTIATDPGRYAVRMSPARLRDPARFAGALAAREPIAGLTRADLEPLAASSGCDLWWRREGLQLEGRSDPSICRGPAAGGRGIARWDWHWVLTAEELWIDHEARDARGTIVAATPGGAPLQLGKARDFECLFGYRPPGDQPVMLNGARMHDRGDVRVWEPVTRTPRRFYYELIRGLWPSSSGRNFEDLLRIYMYEGDPAKPERSRLLGMGWASAASDRASFGDGVYSGRCKLFDPTAPPPRN